MRKEVFVTLQDGGNDVMFRITQMPAMQQARWTSKALIMLAATGVVTNLNMFEVDKLQKQFEKDGIKMLVDLIGKLEYEKVEPLLNELLACCAHVPDKTNRNFVVNVTADNLDSVIGDFQNVYKLAIEAFKVNFTSSAAGSPPPDPETSGYNFYEAYVNVNGMAGVVISRRLATLHELETVYSYEDLLNLYEIVYINNINEHRAYEEAKKNGAR